MREIADSTIPVGMVRLPGRALLRQDWRTTILCGPARAGLFILLSLAGVGGSGFRRAIPGSKGMWKWATDVRGI